MGIYAWYKRTDILKQRIYSPFLLLLFLTWLLIGPAFEIGNHFYVNNWELKESISDLINASFSFFNFGSQLLLALSVRKKDLPLLRCPNFTKGLLKGLLDVITTLADLIFIVGIPLNTVLYNLLGRERSVSLLTPFTAGAGIFTVFRLWFNLGPNIYTKFGGILYLVCALLGVFMLQVYNKTCIEVVHMFIGGSFVFSMVPLTVALWNAELPKDGVENDFVDENTPLV